MSTRSTTHFTDNGKVVAIVYRHSDGYPKGAGRDINTFLKLCKALPDGRLNDPCYLAAKYVVYLSAMFNKSFKRDAAGEIVYVKNESPLEFRSVGVLMEDPSDIDFRYVIDCGQMSKSGLPKVTAYEVSCSYPENVWSQSKGKIPRGKNNWS